MKPLKKKYQVTDETFERMKAAEGTAVEVIKKHLEPQLPALRAGGYTRLEIASAFLILAYHALRYDLPQPKAEELFNAVYACCKERVDQNCDRLHPSRLH